MLIDEIKRQWELLCTDDEDCPMTEMFLEWMDENDISCMDNSCKDDYTMEEILMDVLGDDGECQIEYCMHQSIFFWRKKPKVVQILDICPECKEDKEVACPRDVDGICTHCMKRLCGHHLIKHLEEVHKVSIEWRGELNFVGDSAIER
jgi:hypothetical protein